MRKARHYAVLKRKWAASNRAIVFAMEKEIAGEKPLVRDRALVFSPRLPFAFVTAIPKNANKNAGDTAGGVRGGMPCRPPLVVCNDAISGDFALSAKLLTFLIDVRTFFAENPE